MRDNPRHVDTSPFTRYNCHGKGNFASMVDVAVLGATEVDVDFNANVVTHSDGRLLHGIGGWQNCLFAGCAILPIPSFRDRIPVIVDQVTTLCGPGELIDVIVTERGIAINPRRQDLLDAVTRQRACRSGRSPTSRPRSTGSAAAGPSGPLRGAGRGRQVGRRHGPRHGVAGVNARRIEDSQIPDRSMRPTASGSDVPRRGARSRLRCFDLPSSAL